MSKTIMTIDDSPSVRQMVRMTLTAAGYRVIEATDGRDALDKLRVERPDAILTDQNMPGMDGLTFIRTFRASGGAAGIPIVFVSTETDGTLRAEAKAAGAMGWMVKPFDQTQLVTVVRKVAG